MKKLVSFAIPCYNSAQTILPVINEIEEEMSKTEQFDYEIVTAVDGSPDNVYDVLTAIANYNDKVKVVNLAKNFGQANARMATLRYTKGDYIVCMDDDGQCPVNHILEMLQPLEEGYDIAIADYPKKKQSAFKNIGSNFNKLTARVLLDVPKEFRFSNFFVMKRFLTNQVLEYTNPYPYMEGLISQSTRNIAYVPMEERERISGDTGYTLKKLVGLWLNGLTAFSVKPLRISSVVGMICAILGFIFGIVTVIRKLVIPDISVGWSSTVSIMLFMGGLLMLMLGMVGEYIGRIYISINNAPQYVVRQTLNVEDSTKSKLS